MPRGDGTGPNGMGPMTGRAMGLCAGYDRPGFANFGGGRRAGGWGRGYGFWGRGRGVAPVYPAPVASREADTMALRDEVDMLRTRLDEIIKRLDELAGGKSG
ncbi:MAG TPA: hypothetical protein ENN67_05385 [Firmicutes bacterium]|nr:hypothetical protein [Bacillota bacterium]